MKIIRVAVSALLVGVAQARAQGTDSAVHGSTTATALPRPASTSDVRPDVRDDSTSMAPRCWLGCTGSLNTRAPAEWRDFQQAQAAIAVPTRRAQFPPTPVATRRPIPTSGPAGSTPIATAAGDITPASPGDAQRYLVEEWRRSELGVADSLHHAVLMRISHTFDSAQRSSISQEERSHILRQVDGVDRVNQLMWLERRSDVNHQADSALRAMPTSP
jgi:hypothetical protein